MILSEQTFLLKSEPHVYSFSDFEREGRTAWDGVRNHLAMRHLKAMKLGDHAFIYHSGDERQVVGIAEVIGEARPDPSDPSGKFVCVDLQCVQRLTKPVPLHAFKAANWREFELVRMSRLSCMPVPTDIRDWIMEQAGHTP
mgnify:CR=1 FL=1